MKKAVKKTAIILIAAVLVAAALFAAYFFLVKPMFEREKLSEGMTVGEAEDIEAFIKDNDEVDADEDSGLIYMNRQVVVLADGEAELTDIRALASGYDAELEESMADIGLYLFTFEEAKDYRELDKLIRDLEAENLVEKAYFNTVTLNGEDEVQAVYPDDPWEEGITGNWSDKDNADGSNWGLELIQVPEAWDYLEEMSEVRVGLIDNTVNEDHEDLTFEKVTVNTVSEDGKIEDPKYTVKAESDHGNHVAGTMGADWNNKTGVSGILGNVGKLYFSQMVFEAEGGKYVSRYGTWYSYMHNIKTLADDDVRVINISQNTSRTICFAASMGNEAAQNFIQYQADAMEVALNRYIQQRTEEGKPDFLLVVAAGNVNGYYYQESKSELYGYKELTKYKKDAKSGGAEAVYNNFLNAMDEDTAKAHVITVGAVSNEDKHPYTDFACVGERVDIAAPGTEVYSTGANGYLSLGGTSMACPHVSGTAGLCFAINPELTGPQVKQILITSSTGRYYLEKNGECGLVNAQKAVVLSQKTKGEPAKEVNKLIGSKASGLDLCFVVDTTGSMGDDIDDAKANMDEILAALSAKGGSYRVALVDYRDTKERGGSEDYPSKVQLEFTADETAIRSAIDGLTLGYGGDNPETVFSGLAEAAGLDWRKDAKKVIIVLGDAPPHDPEPDTGYTYEQILTLLTGSGIGIDYKNSDERVLDQGVITLYAVSSEASGDASDFFKQITEDTGGKYNNVDDADEIAGEMIGYIDDIEVDAGYSFDLDFGREYGEQEVDLYTKDGEYLFAFETDSRGRFVVDRMDEKEYSFVIPETGASGTMKVSGKEDKKVELDMAKYRFQRIQKLWKDRKVPLVGITLAVVVVSIFVPVGLGSIVRASRKKKEQDED